MTTRSIPGAGLWKGMWVTLSTMFKTIFLPYEPIDFHPMKGPMMTQTMPGSPTRSAICSMFRAGTAATKRCWPIRSIPATAPKGGLHLFDHTRNDVCLRSNCVGNSTIFSVDEIDDFTR